MKAFALGTGGFVATEEKETACYLLQLGEAGVLLDAGTGIKRLGNDVFRKMISKLSELHIVFSHMHHDHVIGFNWLFKLCSIPLHIHIPTVPLLDKDVSTVLETLTSPPIFPKPIGKWPHFVATHTFGEGGFDLLDHQVKVHRQSHAGGSVGIRIADFAYLTDVDPTEKLVDFVRGCSLVLLDTMYDKAEYNKRGHDPNSPGQHGYGEGNAAFAKKAEIKRLGLIHINPFYDEERRSALLSATKSVFPDAFMPQDGDQLFY